jgi:hypothetical protein
LTMKHHHDHRRPQGTRQPPQQPPDNASRKVRNVRTPPLPKLGLGFSPRAGGTELGQATSTTSPRREPAPRVLATLWPSPARDYPRSLAPPPTTRPHRANPAEEGKIPMRDENLPRSGVGAGGEPTTPTPHAHRHPAAHTAGDTGQHHDRRSLQEDDDTTTPPPPELPLRCPGGPAEVVARCSSPTSARTDQTRRPVGHRGRARRAAPHQCKLRADFLLRLPHEEPRAGYPSPP